MAEVGRKHSKLLLTHLTHGQSTIVSLELTHSDHQHLQEGHLGTAIGKLLSSHLVVEETKTER